MQDKKSTSGTSSHTLNTTRKSGKVHVAAKRLDRRKYGLLLAKAAPIVITTDEENERLLGIIETLLDKKARTVEEEALLDLLTRLVEDFEDEHYPIPNAPPHVMIQGFMHDRGLRNKDLEPILGSSGVTSDVINGKRKPSKKQIKALGAFFGVAPELFLSLD
jgi:HTH-type transcriptional regulator / antitoxin HigA